MKKKISELKLYQIDYLIAKAEFKYTDIKPYIVNNICHLGFIGNEKVFSPTTNPSQAWPIIERECIELLRESGNWLGAKNLIACVGETSLEAAMRCLVHSVFGEEVDI